MKLIELQTDDALFEPQPLVRRSPGIHVSDVIRSIENAVTKPGQRKAFEDLTEAERRRMGAYIHGGFAWEEVIRRAVVDMYTGAQGRFISPGELCCDGLIGTPDWYDTEDDCIEEFKCTWRSSRRDIESEFRSWWWQMMAYCYMADTKGARLRVFFVNGDYKDSGPQIKQWQAVFNDEELERNWRMLTQYARGMRK